eukprot:CAMPEP_0117696770 /NCGR_PEP_ID=MMETSP0804-20121206/28853_1 /TAXON_ID=1074897 /ORGANISM="Tetraselmis astigmatica, Strain CCMP880" /LENGTH=67 /DNA_ID=CAMNT_0005510937 /DNA_START=517 /DNA_END=720 /DNA_ORIENTATION=+
MFSKARIAPSGSRRKTWSMIRMYAALVSRNQGADFAEEAVAVVCRQSGSVPVGDLGRPFLEGCVHKA